VKKCFSYFDCFLSKKKDSIATEKSLESSFQRHILSIDDKMLANETFDLNDVWSNSI